jgi:integrase
VQVVFRYVSAIFRAAVADRLIASSPCVGIKLPKVEHAQVEPLAVEEVEALIVAAPDRYRALIVFAAGTGLRQGECFGLTRDRIDFLRRTVKVDRREKVQMPVASRRPNAGQAMSWKRRATARAVSRPPNRRTTGTTPASATCPPTHTVAPRTCKNSRMVAAWTANTNGDYDALHVPRRRQHSLETRAP